MRRAGPAVRRAVRRHWLVLVPWLGFLAVSLPGVDFGYHWDEGHAHLTPLERSIERRVPMPGNYTYPGFNYLVNVAALVPDAIAATGREEPLSSVLSEAVGTRDYRVRMRALRALLSSLAIPVLYALGLAIGGSRWEALLAAALLAGSWEFVYHSRWPASDAIMAAFGVASILASVRVVRTEQPRAAVAGAAAAAGLACGTKYPGGMFLAFVFLAIYLRALPSGLAAREPWERVGLPCLRAAGIFAATYLLTTPGTILEARLFWKRVALQVSTYGGGGKLYEAYAVEGFTDHLRRLVEYLALEGLVADPSWGRFVALGAPFGAWRLVRRSPREAAVVVGFPVVYALYFSQQQLMLVRNYVVLLPFLALFSAWGWGGAWRMASSWSPAIRYPVRGALGLALAGLVGLGAVWQVRATESIRTRRDETRHRQELRDYIDARASVRFLLSPGAASDVGAGHGPNIVADSASGPFDEVVVRLYELGDFFPAHRMPSPFVTWFGPREVNLARYTTWRGDDRPVVLRADRARALGLVIPQLFRRSIEVTKALQRAGRQTLLRAGGEGGSDALVLVGRGGGRARLELEHRDGPHSRRWRRVDAPGAVLARRETGFETVDLEIGVLPDRRYRLDVLWDAYRGHVEVSWDGTRVFAASEDLVLAGLDQFEIGGATLLEEP